MTSTPELKDRIKQHFNGKYLSFFNRFLANLKHLKGDEYQTRCCFHPDTKPSLSINAKKGQYYCHGCKANGDIFKFYGVKHNLNGNFHAILKGIANDFGITGPIERKQVTRYFYRDADGVPVHSTVRTEPKDFYQEKYEDGRWVKGLKGVKRILYRLPQVMKAEEIIIVEGEKDADRLSDLGFTATTCPMGAGQWCEDYNQYLKGKNIVLIPDNDAAGKNHMTKVAESLNGHVSSIKLVELAGLPNKGDVSDYIAGFTDPKMAADRLSILMDQAEPYKSSAIPEPSPDGFENGIITFQEFVEMEMPKKQVFLDPWITEQSITLISGWRGTGKTWLALSILIAISKGKPFGPWETLNSVPSLYLDGEMPQQDMQYRARELKINKGCISPAYLYSDAHRTILGQSRANLLDGEWREQMAKVLLGKEIKLWVIDNIASLAPGINENAKEDWDPVNAWLLELRFAGIASILLHHVGKGGSQRGTSAREDNVDTSILLKQPDDYQSDDGCRFIMQFKKNRVVSGDHFLIADQEFKYEHGKWQYDNPKTKNKYMVWRLLDEGKPQNKIAKELKLSASRVSQIRKKGVDGEYLSNTGKLTPFGRESVDKN